MEIITDLQRILWHELGHFCVDLLDTEENKNFTIDGFWVSYHRIAISGQNWGGGVRTVPPINLEALVEDNDKSSFFILSLISGCMFQTVFLKKFQQTKIGFEDCFCPQAKCAGKIDEIIFYQIASKLRTKHGLKKDFIRFSESEILDIYYDAMVENQNFLQLINELINKQKDNIFEIYQQFENNDEFKYNFEDNKLKTLKEEVYRIMLDTSFKDTIIKLKEMIKKKMLA